MSAGYNGWHRAKFAAAAAAAPGAPSWVVLDIDVPKVPTNERLMSDA